MAMMYVFESPKDHSDVRSVPLHEERDAKAIDHLQQKGWLVVKKWEEGDEDDMIVDADQLVPGPAIAVGDLPGIHNRLAAALRVAGYKTSEDLERASDEALLAVDGVAQKSLERIRAALAYAPAEE